VTELEQFKTILATLCLEHEDLPLGQALLLADEIMTKMRSLPINPMISDPSVFDETTPHEIVDTWLRTRIDIRDMPKINGIKEIRACTQLGLRDAKLAHERVWVGAWT